MKAFTTLALLASAVAAEILWDGRFNDIKSAADLESWSWSNQVGPYQYYIHGSGKVDEYVALSADFANPADGSSKQGAKISLTDTAFWNGQNMRRTELIPQTSAKIAAGKVFYHFSLKRGAQNVPSTAREHQIAFFESHFTELKSGGSTGENLAWFVGGASKWEAKWEADVWHNVAYEIDFDAKTVGLWHSTGADSLAQVVKPIAASTSSNGADWHVGVLELPGSEADKNEDFFFSGVYIESGDITTSFGGSGGKAPDSGSAPASSAAPAPQKSTDVSSPTTKAADAAPAATSAAEPAGTQAPVVESPVVESPVAEAPQQTEAAQETKATEQTQAAPTVAGPTTFASQIIPTADANAPSKTAVETLPQTTRKPSCKRRRRARRAL